LGATLGDGFGLPFFMRGIEVVVDFFGATVVVRAPFFVRGSFGGRVVGNAPFFVRGAADEGAVGFDTPRALVEETAPPRTKAPTRNVAVAMRAVRDEIFMGTP
jgi:hypothetical protein